MLCKHVIVTMIIVVALQYIPSEQTATTKCGIHTLSEFA